MELHQEAGQSIPVTLDLCWLEIELGGVKEMADGLEVHQHVNVSYNAVIIKLK